MSDNISELDTLFQEGYSLYWEGDYMTAFKYFKKSIKKHGRHYLKSFYQGQALSAKGRLTDSISYFTESINQKQDFFEAFIAMATAYEKLGNIEKALEVYKNALDRDPTGDEKVEIIKNRVKLIKTLEDRKIEIPFYDDFEEGMYDYVYSFSNSACKHFEKHIEKNSEDHIAYLYSAIVHCYNHEPKKGIERIDVFLKFNPNHAKAWHVKARLLERNLQYQLAIECCNKAIELDPRNSSFQNSLSRLQGKSPKPQPIKRKKPHLKEKPRKKEEESPFPPLFGMALVFHTAKKYASDKSERARELANFLGKFRIDEYIKLQIDFMSMYYLITDQAKLNKTVDEIIDLSAKLLYFSTKDPVAFDIFNEALVYLNNSKLGKAIELMKKAIELSPNNPIYMFDLFNAYQKIGNIKKANDLRAKIEQKVRNLQSKDYAKTEFGVLQKKFKDKLVYVNNLMEKYKNITDDKKGIITLLSILTSEIMAYLKNEETRLKDQKITSVIDDCLFCFELLSFLASVVFFKHHSGLGDETFTTQIKDCIIMILGWEPEPLPSIQTPNYLSPALRKKAWINTLGMDVLSFSMMDSIQEAKYVHIDGDLGNDNPKTHIWYSNESANQMSIGRQHTTHDRSERNKIEEYLEAQFGEPLTIMHDKGDQLVHVDIYVYPTTEERPFGMMITSGMSERPMDAPPEAWKVCWPIDPNKIPPEKRGILSCKYAELVVKLPPDWPLPKPGEQLKNDEYFWPIEELHHLIYYVHRERQWFWDGHTMRSRDDGSLAFAPNTKLAGWVFLHPPHFPPPFGMLKINDSKAICFLQIVPAYIEEIQYAMQYSTKKLFEKFRQENIPDFIAINRKNVCL